MDSVASAMNITPSASGPATSGASGNSTHAPKQLVLSAVSPARFSSAWQNPAIIISQCNKKCTSLFAAGVKLLSGAGAVPAAPGHSFNALSSVSGAQRHHGPGADLGRNGDPCLRAHERHVRAGHQEPVRHL